MCSCVGHFTLVALPVSDVFTSSLLENFSWSLELRALPECLFTELLTVTLRRVLDAEVGEHRKETDAVLT